jgi:hypothetical protein
MQRLCEIRSAVQDRPEEINQVDRWRVPFALQLPRSPREAIELLRGRAHKRVRHVVEAELFCEAEQGGWA